MHTTIYHNPRCGTSRNTLALLRHLGFEPVVIEYLNHPPSTAQLRQIIQDAGMNVRELIRAKEPIYHTLGLDNPQLSEDELLAHMRAHPILINRPVVITPLGTRLCRPSEVLLTIVPACTHGQFVKEDGGIIDLVSGAVHSPN